MKLGKCWQSKSHELVWQYELEDQRGFLIVSTSGISTASAKPTGLNEPQGAASIIRKYLPSCFVSFAAKDKDHLALGLSRAGEEYLLVVAGHEIQLIAPDRRSLFRLTPSALFTKPKADAETFIPATQIDLLQLCSPETEEHKTEVPQTVDPETRVLLGKLRRRRKTLVKTLAEWRTHVPDDRHIILAERTASALQEQLWSLENNSVVVTMDDGTTEFVELNPDLSPGANMTAAFTKARKLRRAKEMGEVRTIKLEDNLQIIDQLLNDKTIPFDTLVFKAKQLGIKIDAPRPQTQTKARETTARLFLLQDHCIYVARSSHEGDELVKKAKSNDIWLHVAGGGHGAHVIVPFKKNLDLSDMTGVLRSAAILALHFSDLKNNLSGEVYMSRRAQLRKTKGLPPGKWLMNAVETRKITYDENERDQIFKSQQNL